MALRLENRVLVLNRGWQPVNIVGVCRAVTMLFQEHAEVVFTDETGNHQILDTGKWLEFSAENPDPARCIRTVRLALRIPPVLLLKTYDRVPRREVRFCRSNVYARDGYICQYCGRRLDEHELNLDHVVPCERGGKTNWENIVTSCIRCNSHKANRLPHQAGMSLRKMPARPKWKNFVASAIAGTEREIWKPFLETASAK